MHATSNSTHSLENKEGRSAITSKPVDTRTYSAFRAPTAYDEAELQKVMVVARSPSCASRHANGCMTMHRVNTRYSADQCVTARRVTGWLLDLSHIGWRRCIRGSVVGSQQVDSPAWCLTQQVQPVGARPRRVGDAYLARGGSEYPKLVEVRFRGRVVRVAIFQNPGQVAADH